MRTFHRQGMRGKGGHYSLRGTLFTSEYCPGGGGGGGTLFTGGQYSLRHRQAKMALSKSTPRGASTQEQLAKFEIKVIEGLTEGESTGSGSFGAVYPITVDGVPRIAKRLHNILLTPDIRPQDKAGIREKFYDECLLLSKLDHPCIVQFVGVHFHGSDVTLVMERLYSDLERFLDPEQRPNIPLSIKLSILLDVSCGLLYLHTQLEEPLVHRDLKPENILITKDLRAKIADLGVSKLLKNYPQSAAIQTKCPGTLAYMPPEALSENPKYNASLDIFSYGQLALYTAIQTFPEVYSGFGNPKMTSAFRIGESEILRRKKWIDRLSHNYCLRSIILQCLKDTPEERPTTLILNDKMKTLCAKNPRSLDDIVSIWEEKVQ